MSDHEALWKDYEQTLASFRQFGDLRFRLLALLPSISGVAIGLVSHDLAAFKSTPLPRLLIGLLGFFVTLGIVFYDRRNSQLYDSLGHRAKRLERVLSTELPGQLHSQPAHTPRFLGIFEIGHDRGLALIYGSVLGAWLFPVACGLLWIVDAGPWMPANVPALSALIALVFSTLMVFELYRLDSTSSKARTSTEDQSD